MKKNSLRILTFMYNKKKIGIIFPLVAYKDRKHYRGKFVFPFWNKLISKLKQKFDITIYDGKTYYPKFISDKNAHKKIEYRLQNGKYWSKYLKSKKIDFILQHHIHPMLSAQYRDKTFVLTDTYAKHTFDANKIKMNKNMTDLNELEKNYLQQVKHIFAYYNGLKESMIKELNIKPNKVSVAAPGSFIEPKNYEKDYKKQIILFIGSPFRFKGGKQVISAFRTIKKIFPKSKLIIVSQPEKKDLINLPEDVTIIKNISYNDKKTLSKLYKDASILLLPGKKANYPNPIIEAMSFKVPVIATNMPGATKELLGNNCGIIIENNNLKSAIIKNVSKLFRNNNLMKKIGEAGYKKYLKNYSFDLFCKKIINNIERQS